MTGPRLSVRDMATYAVVLPLALLMGFLLAEPTHASIFGVGLMVLVLAMPLVMKWHYPLLLLAWNSTAVVFFLPGTPQLWLLMAFWSFLIVVVQRCLAHDMKMIYPPSIVIPLFFLSVVVIFTAYFRGGIGLAALGSASMGGKRYLMIFGAILGFLAMTSREIPRERAYLYLGLFFLGSWGNVIANLLPYVPRSMYFLFLIFPPEEGGISAVVNQESPEMMRPWALSLACTATCFYLLARHGAAELLNFSRPWRSFLFLVALAIIPFGGFRSFLMLALLTFLFVFVFEGLLRSRHVVRLMMAGILGAALVVPFADKLPMSIQRTLSFLPIDVSPMAKLSARASSEWRVEMWQNVMPEIPQYLLLGKGLSIDARDFERLLSSIWRGDTGTAQGAALASDFHNGPLSLVISFGLFGVVGFVWFLGAAVRALYLNYKYGDPALRRINQLLLSLFLARCLLFFVVVGGFYSDLAYFTGLIALSLCFNGGIRRAVDQEEAEPDLETVDAGAMGIRT